MPQIRDNLSKNEIDTLFDLKKHTKNIPYIFDKVFKNK